MLAESLRGVVAQQLLKRADGKGRVAAYEVLVANQAVRSLIREQKTFQLASTIGCSRKDGMQTLDQHLLELVQNRVRIGRRSPQVSEQPATLTAQSCISRHRTDGRRRVTVIIWPPSINARRGRFFEKTVPVRHLARSCRALLSEAYRP